MFELNKGAAQRVDAVIEIPADTQPGVYNSRITVEGFNHSHFDLVLEVTPAKEQPKEESNEAKAAAATEPPAVETNKVDYNSMTVKELKAMAKKMGITGFPTLSNQIRYIPASHGGGDLDHRKQLRQSGSNC